MTARTSPPPDVLECARERAAARAEHDFARADALRAQIEAAGWKVIDRRTSFHLEPAAPPTLEEDGGIRYGHATDVPSLLDAPPTAPFTVEVIAEDWPDDLARTLAGLREHAPAGTQVIVVANQPSPDQAARLAIGSPDLAPIAGGELELVWTSERLGHAAARNVGLRRVRGEIVILADPSVEPVGDALSPLAHAFEDPRVAVAGAAGFVTSDLRRYADAPGPSADVIGLAWLAFRRADYVSLGPLDERFAFFRSLDVWWSLRLRAGADKSAPPREARRIDLPLARHEDRAWTALPDAERDRLSKRNFYRVLDEYRDRADLRSGA